MNSRFSAQERVWGLYHKDAQTAIPLKSLHASISIVNTISRVKYTQNYFNDSDKIIETEFFFPISSDACFDAFEATFNDTTIRGVIKRKEQAKEEYKEALAQGKTAAYSEINEETGDIMKVMIGNIPPSSTIAITYSYIQKLEVAANKFLCFRLFSTITPRYNGNLQDALKADIALLSNYPTISSQDPQAYPWTVEADIQSPSPITFVKSPSHDIAPVYGNEKHTCTVTFKSNAAQYPNKDFILLYTSENKQDKIDYMITPFEEGYCAMVNVRADFQTASNETVYENLVKAKEIEHGYSMDEVRGEYIFLIDRSGSMDGDRIVMARESLLLFLKSLPQDSLFNVVSFGSDYQFLFSGSSQKYNQETLEQSIKQIERFDADMGGTEIYEALDKIFRDPVKADYPRSLFLLTDGGVSNTNQVLDLIRKNNTKAKTFTIGIGNGCSQELITQGAACGHGKHEFVANNNEIYEKVISLLNASLSPCYSNISLESDNFDAVVRAITPNPSTIPLLIDGQTTTFFLLLRSEAFTNNNNKMALKLSMNDSRAQKRRTIDISLDPNEAIQNELIPKLAVHDMIRRLETDKENIVWMSKEDVKENLVDLSLKYGILCKETAFLCETEKSSVKTLQDTQKIKIVIPAPESYDRFSSLGSGYNYRSSSPKSYITGTNSIQSQEAYLDLLSETMNVCKQATKSMSSELSYQNEMLHCSAPASKSKKKSSGGVLNSISKAFGSLFGSKAPESNSRNKSIPQPKTSNASASYQQQQYQPSMSLQNESCKREAVMDDYDEECEEEACYDMKEKEEVCESLSRKQDISEALPIRDSKKSANSGSYLQVIMKQKFEGFWDPQDSAIHQTILKNGVLPEAPEQIKNIDATLAQTIWLTLLVLLWLEVSCQADRKAWLLIYQKGINWLKNKGVNYEDTKSLGASEVRA